MKYRDMAAFKTAAEKVFTADKSGNLTLSDADALRKQFIDELVFNAAFNGLDEIRDASRWLVRKAAEDSGIRLASIQGFYDERAQGKHLDVCVPAVNIRGMSYDVARALVAAANATNAGAFIFEIARSEMGYTFQRPDEYAVVMLAAAIREGFTGPLFVQGDHFQVKTARYAKDPDGEMNDLNDLIREAVAAGFYNIDVDASTLVDLSKDTVDEQQELNCRLTAEFTKIIRDEEPKGVTVSVGGEIGEVGGKNSTLEELEAYLNGYRDHLKTLDKSAKGISKISIQTGTSHGGVPLPDGTVADVALDLQVLSDLSRESRESYGLAGAVQHGASTLPAEAFNQLTKNGACEVHLATEFQNVVYEHPRFPRDLRERIYKWLRDNCEADRKPDMTDAQFYYKTRKKGWGPYREEVWQIPGRESIRATLVEKFQFLFEELGAASTKDAVEAAVDAPSTLPKMPKALREAFKG